MQSWDFTEGYLPEGGHGFTTAEIQALSKRWHQLRIEEVKHRLGALPPLLACRVLGSGSAEIFIPLQEPDMRPSNAYLIVPIRQEDSEESVHSLLLSPKAGTYAVIKNPAYLSLCETLHELSPLECVAWAEVTLLDGNRADEAIEQVSGESFQQRLRYREVRRRTKSLPSELWQRIVWDSAIECFVPGASDPRAADRGYFVLPVKSQADEHSCGMLLLPPGRGRPTVIPWIYSSQSVASLMERLSPKAADWINMMIEEFGLTDAETCAWFPPKYDGSKAGMERVARFIRELRTAQGREFLVRKQRIIDSLDQQGLFNPLGFVRHLVIPFSDENLDPELATYVVEFRFELATLCVISRSGDHEPVITTCSYEWVRECMSTGEKDQLQAWLKQISDGNEDEDLPDGEDA